jgi:peptidyl-prolyl cis-trans isomerase SurA
MLFASVRTRLGPSSLLSTLGLSLLALCALGFTASRASATIVERIVAIVDQTPILLTDLQGRARPFLIQVFASTPEGPQRTAAISQVYSVVLERIIEEELEDAAANRAGIAVSAKEVDDALARLAAQNNISVPELLEEASRTGLSTSEYRTELNRQLLQSKLASLRLNGRIRVDEADIRGAYQDLIYQERGGQAQRTARIVMPLGKTAEEQLENVALAEEVVALARSGEDFSRLLREYGTLPGSGTRPPAPPSQEVKAIERASLSLDVGQVSRPIRVNHTLVILKILDRPPTSLPPYEEAREAIYQRVYMEKMSKARKHWLDGLRRRTHIEIRK